MTSLVHFQKLHIDDSWIWAENGRTRARERKSSAQFSCGGSGNRQRREPSTFHCPANTTVSCEFPQCCMTCYINICLTLLQSAVECEPGVEKNTSIVFHRVLIKVLSWQIQKVWLCRTGSEDHVSLPEPWNGFICTENRLWDVWQCSCDFIMKDIIWFVSTHKNGIKIVCEKTQNGLINLFHFIHFFKIHMYLFWTTLSRIDLNTM